MRRRASTNDRGTMEASKPFGVAHEPGRRFHRGAALTLAICASIVGVAVALPAEASAAFHIKSFNGLVADQTGASYTQAAGHPYQASTTIEFPAIDDDPATLTADGSVRDVRVDLPPGLIGNPEAVPSACTYETLVSGGGRCPITSQVGIATVHLGSAIPSTNVYKLTPSPGAPARFGLLVEGVPVVLIPSLRSGSDYGLTVGSKDISQAYPIFRVTVTFWGVPADPSHDGERGIAPIGHPAEGDTCARASIDKGTPCNNPAGYQPVAFLTNPSNCAAGALTTSIVANTWQESDVFASASFNLDTNGNPTAATGCEKVPFDPQMSVQPTTTTPDSPTGLGVELVVPEDGLVSRSGLAQGNLKRAVVTLPKGMTISPSSADGLAACSDADLRMGSDAAASCPDASKIGTVSIDTPLLADPLEGAVYVRPQASDDPASGEMFRIAIVVDNPVRGIRVKLAGQVAADPEGTLRATFDNNPQLPFSRLSLRMKGGPRAPLATPPTCGPAAATAEMTSWSGQTVSRVSSFTIDCPGVQGFAPKFTAGTVNPVAGASTDFALAVNRSDGQEYVEGLALDLPPGLIANLKNVPLCGDGDAAAGTCPLGSRVGTATVGAGPGSSPFFLGGSVSLTGPYKGAPYGLSAAVRAVAGPFDLGMVVVRQALFVDPTDAHVTVVSDPLPIVVKGVPVRLRSLDVKVDRAGFMRNPTSCKAKRINAFLTSSGGTLAPVGSPFQAAQCATLGFKPSLAMRLTGPNQRREGQHPGLTTVLRQGAGQANIEAVEVKLPLALALDPENAQELCEFEAGKRIDCPRSSIVGRAKAVTPVLNRPLAGPVFFVKNVRIDPKTGRQRRTLPTLLVTLRGEVALNLRATTSVERDKLVTTFPTVPDAPVSRFELTIDGGNNGIIVANRDLCGGRPLTSRVESDAQNGKRRDFNARMARPCGKASKRR